MHFQVHTLDSAPADSRETLGMLVKGYGFLPNLAGAVAESPATLGALVGFMTAYDSKDMTLSPLERQVVLLAVSVRNKCEYCTAAHSMLCNMTGLERSEIDRLQAGEPLGSARLEALRRFAETVVGARGWVADADLQRFLASGFTRAQVFEVVFGVALKTLTNYANHIARPSVNEQFAAFLPTWSRAA